nr:immunoglobulin light chain junction region [Macaca mulatta]MOY04944.1 immunoglobulin light chain junction region [Macaca mulatta]MOY05309.1 immunoglobulin light chain junction region [Macaca mulatta]MOY05549.1 immunoglobulin light chain junction region [Macaca mulatta]MOY05906.1 immunoglobulin light chain junction region [Macaca mulatta]
DYYCQVWDSYSDLPDMF